MKRIINITVDLKCKYFNTIMLKQMDTTILNIDLLDNSQSINMTGLTADSIFTKPNGTIVIQNATIDTSNNKVVVELMEDCVRSYGKAKIEIELKKNDEVISTFQIDAKIEKTSKGNIESDNTPNYIEYMEDAIEEAREGIPAIVRQEIDDKLPEIEDDIEDEVLNRFSDALSNKVDKVTGKGLSTNDFTNEYKNQVDTNTDDITDIKAEQTTQNNNISNLQTNKANKNETYTKTQTDALLANKEDNSNKVNEINENSTNTQYPGAKCVYDSQKAQDEEIKKLNSIKKVLPTVTGEGTEITLENCVDDAPLQLDIKGNVLQDTSEKIYICDGTETGDYYFTYNNVSYYFTMPIIASGDILVFNTIDAELTLNGDVISTLETGTGTALTLLDTPYLLYPKDVKVVKGEQNIKVEGKNLFDYDTASGIQNQERCFGKFNFNGENGFSGYALNNWPTSIFSFSLQNFKASTKYTISFELRTNHNGLFENKIYIDKAGGVIYPSSSQRNIIANKWNTIYFTFNSGNITSLNGSFGLYGPRIKTKYDIKNIQIYEGDYIGDTGKCYSKNYTLSLGDLELFNGYNWTDYLFKNEEKSHYYSNELDENAWYKVSKVLKMELDGSENWQRASISGENNKYYFSLSVPTMITYPWAVEWLYSNRQVGLARLPVSSGATGINISSKKILYGAKFLQDYTLEEFKNWLAEHPTTIYVESTDITYTKITDSTLIAQLEDINNAVAVGGKTIITSTSISSDNIPAMIEAKTYYNIEDMLRRLAIIETEV